LQAQKHAPTRILVEDSGMGPQLAKELQRTGLPALAIKPQGNKETRFKAQTVKFEGRRVSLLQGPWNEVFEAEYLAVPNSQHDDMIDATCMALDYATENTGYRWDAITTKNYGEFVEALAFNAIFGGL
jgi:predicted phage terminase large subunit-like protein